jgi:hypothetical protein
MVHRVSKAVPAGSIKRSPNRRRRIPRLAYVIHNEGLNNSNSQQNSNYNKNFFTDKRENDGFKLDIFDDSKPTRSLVSGRTKNSSMRHASAIVNFYVCGNWHLSSALANERYMVWLELEYLYYALLALVIQVVLGWGK